MVYGRTMVQLVVSMGAAAERCLEEGAIGVRYRAPADRSRKASTGRWNRLRDLGQGRPSQNLGARLQLPDDLEGLPRRPRQGGEGTRCCSLDEPAAKVNLHFAHDPFDGGRTSTS